MRQQSAPPCSQLTMAIDCAIRCCRSCDASEGQTAPEDQENTAIIDHVDGAEAQAWIRSGNFNFRQWRFDEQGKYVGDVIKGTLVPPSEGDVLRILLALPVDSHPRQPAGRFADCLMSAL